MINNINVLYVNRFFDGITFGVALVVCSLYSIEVLPTKLKVVGTMLIIFFINFGGLVGGSSGYIFGAEKLTQNWRVFIAWPIVLVIIRILILLYINIESPLFI